MAAAWLAEAVSEAVWAEELVPGEVGTHQLPCIAESFAFILEGS